MHNFSMFEMKTLPSKLPPFKMAAMMRIARRHPLSKAQMLWASDMGASNRTFSTSTLKDVMSTPMSQIMNDKQDEMSQIMDEKSVFEAVTILADKKKGAILVTNKAGGVTGIFTERDYLTKIILMVPKLPYAGPRM